jgi:hypothetical protein
MKSASAQPVTPIRRVRIYCLLQCCFSGEKFEWGSGSYPTRENLERGKKGLGLYCIYAKFENYVVRLPHIQLNFYRIIEIIDPIRL